MMENMQVPQIAPEGEAYAEQVGQEQYDLAMWMGMPESQAQEQGQYAYDSVEVQLEDEAMYEQAAYVEGYQRFMDTMAANQVAKEEKRANFEAMKRQKDLKRREARETQRLTDEYMKKMIDEKRAVEQ